MRALLDTSVLIDAPDLGDVEAAISVASLAELHFGVLVATDAARPGRLRNLAFIEAAFEPLPLDAPVARAWGGLAAAVRERGGKPRRRTMDLVIAATAQVHDVPLLTYDVQDFQLIGDLVDVREPSAPR